MIRERARNNGRKKGGSNTSGEQKSAGGNSNNNNLKDSVKAGGVGSAAGNISKIGHNVIKNSIVLHTSSSVQAEIGSMPEMAEQGVGPTAAVAFVQNPRILKLVAHEVGMTGVGGGIGGDGGGGGHSRSSSHGNPRKGSLAGGDNIATITE